MPHVTSFVSRAALAALVLLGAAASAAAHEYTVGSLTVDHPWARATVGTSRPGGAYLTIINKGSTPDRLIGAESPVAARIEMHQSRMEGGMMRMAPVESIAVPAGATAKLVPGVYHLMLMGLKAPLEAGARIPLTLIFEKAGRVEAKITVVPLGGKGDGRDMKGMGH